MINQQLSEYVKTQRGNGIADEAIKNALLGAGWPAADVEEALRPGTSSEAVSPAPIVADFPAQTEPAVSPASPAATSISPAAKVSEIVFQPETFSMEAGQAVTSPAVTMPEDISTQKKAEPRLMDGSIIATSAQSAKKPFKEIVWSVAAGVLVAAFAGLAVFFYTQNSSYRARVVSLGTEKNNLVAQVSDLAAKNKDLTEQAKALGEAQDTLKNELFVFAPRRVVSAAERAISLRGKLDRTAKGEYILETDEGALFTVKNSKDKKVEEALSPFVKVATVKMGGIYIEGSGKITVNSVNDQSLSEGAAISSSPVAPQPQPPVTPPPPPAPAQ